MKSDNGKMAAIMAAITQYLEKERVPPPPPRPSGWKLFARQEMARRRDPTLWRGRKGMMRYEK
jgi:hypothetical protein